MIISIQTVLQFLIFFQTFFFAAFLIGNTKGKKSSNILLAILLLLLGTQMAGFILRVNGFNFIINYNSAFGFTYGPLLYLYTKSLIQKNFKFNRSDLFGLAPFFIVILLVTFGLEDLKNGIHFFYILSILSYLFLSFRQINRYRQILKQTQSDFERQNLSWLKLAFFLFILVFSTDFIQLFSNVFSINLLLQQFSEILVFVSLLVFTTVMVYKGLVQPEIFSGINKDDEQYSVKYASSSLSEDDSKKSILRLDNLMNENKPFLVSSLSLNELANSLEMPPRHLSQIINEQKGKNFLDYINSLRIEEATQLLEHPNDEKQTIQEVMYTVGFNSKSAFHYAFKKKTNLTPTEFKRKFYS